MVKVSIVVPVYNVETYLEKCIQSVISQSLHDIEIILVNDGSTDASGEIIRRFAQRDKRIRIIDKPNSGYGNSMNVGMDAARGEYIGIVESDDYVPREMYKELYLVAQNHDVDFVKADFFRFYDEKDGGSTVVNRLTSDMSVYGRVINPMDEPDTLKLKMNTWSGIYKRDFLVKNNIRHNETPGASYQDNGFWFQTFYFADRAYFLRKPFYMNRRDNPNSSVYSKAKVYAMCDEFQFIFSIMDRYPARRAIFMPYIMYKKLHNYEMTYHRIAEESKSEFLARFRDEFIAEQEALVESIFTPIEWRRVKNLLINEELYLLDAYSAQLEDANLALQEELAAIKGSLSFRLGRKMTAPLRFLRDTATH